MKSSKKKLVNPSVSLMRAVPLETKFDAHTALLNVHTTVLNEHTALLNEHSTILNEHTARFDRLETMLAEVLTRLPEKP